LFIEAIVFLLLDGFAHLLQLMHHLAIGVQQRLALRGLRGGRPTAQSIGLGFQISLLGALHEAALHQVVPRENTLGFVRRDYVVAGGQVSYALLGHEPEARFFLAYKLGAALGQLG
jgi:hypothetical protein